MPYSREALAWAAGFFDGEGCTTYHQGGKYQYYQPRLRVGQSGKNGGIILTKFQKAVGGLGKVYGPYKIAKNQTLRRWVYQAWGLEHVQAIMAMLWLWLNRDKKKQATKILRKRR